MQHYTKGLLPTQFNNIWITNQARLNLASATGQSHFILRNSDDLYFPICKLSSLKKHPLFQFPKIWSDFNKPEIKILRDKSEFNSKLKEHFIMTLSSNYTCGRLLCPHCHLWLLSIYSDFKSISIINFYLSLALLQHISQPNKLKVQCRLCVPVVTPSCKPPVLDPSLKILYLNPVSGH